MVNEEICSLILNQHAALGEGKLTERQRISEDLYDGVGFDINLKSKGIGLKKKKARFQN